MGRKKKTEDTEVVSGDIDFFISSVQGLDNVHITDAKELRNPEPNSTGSLSLDNDLVIPIPAGRYIEIFGPEHSGKSSLLLEIMGQALLAGRACLYLNLEKNLNLSLIETIRPIKEYLASLKPEEKSLFRILDSVSGENALEAARQFAMQFPGGIVGIDSVDALLPEENLTRPIGDTKVANLPSLMSDALRKLLDASYSNDVAFIFTNQYRSKIEKFQMGDPRTTSGGYALKYYTSQRIALKSPGQKQLIKGEGNDTIGHVVRYTIIKNKCAPSPVEGEFPLLYFNGIYREQEIINFALKFGILQTGGKGGKQVMLPKLDIEGNLTEETILMSQFKAARRLLLDRQLYKYLEKKVKEIHTIGNFQQSIQNFLEEEDEIQDS